MVVGYHALHGSHATRPRDAGPLMTLSIHPVTWHVYYHGAAAQQLPQPTAVAEAGHGEDEAVAARRLGGRLALRLLAAALEAGDQLGLIG